MVKKMADAATQQVRKMQPPRKEPEKGKPRIVERLSRVRPLTLLRTKPQPEPIRDGSKGNEPIDFFEALKVEPVDLEKEVEKINKETREMDNQEFVVKLGREHGYHPGDKKILDAILG